MFPCMALFAVQALEYQVQQGLAAGVAKVGGSNGAATLCGSGAAALRTLSVYSGPGCAVQGCDLVRGTALQTQNGIRYGFAYGMWSCTVDKWP